MKCEKGIESLKQYQRQWDDSRKIFRDEPLHDWTSHAADAFRYGALMTKDRIAFKAPERAEMDYYALDGIPRGNRWGKTQEILFDPEERW